jgi:hypothetical protein
MENKIDEFVSKFNEFEILNKENNKVISKKEFKDIKGVSVLEYEKQPQKVLSAQIPILSKGNIWLSISTLVENPKWWKNISSEKSIVNMFELD